MAKKTIEELLIEGKEEYIELFLKENKNSEDIKKLKLLEKQINCAKDIWGY